MTVLAGAALLAACDRPVPVAQDGTELWLAASRPYSEVLASVQADIDSALPAEAFHIYDADGQRHVAAGSATVTRNIQTYHYLRPIPQGQLDNMQMDDAAKAAYQNPGYPVN